MIKWLKKQNLVVRAVIALIVGMLLAYAVPLILAVTLPEMEPIPVTITKYGFVFSAILLILSCVDEDKSE